MQPETSRPPTSVDQVAWFEIEASALLATSRKACLRLLAWAPQEHEAIIQEAMTRALAGVRRGAAGCQKPADLHGYIYGVTRHCISETARALQRAEVRACALPEDDPALLELLREDEHAGPDDPGDPGRRLLQVLRYHVKHAFASETEARRRRTLRDTYVVTRHYLRGDSIPAIARRLGLTDRACRYAVDRTLQSLLALLDPGTGEARSFVESSASFGSVTELSDYLRALLPAAQA